MGIQENSKLQHWNYFLALDADATNMARYLEPTEANYLSHSLELARMLFAAASEVDVIAKMLCQKINGDSQAKSINKYREEILARYPNISDSIVTAPRYGLTFHPWNPWKQNQTPLWWDAYNNVKHHRHTHFSDANLKHALNAVAGLFVLLLYYYQDEGKDGKLNPLPSFFRAGQPFDVGQNVFGLGEIIYTFKGE